MLSVLSDRASEERISVIENFDMEQPKTREIATMLSALPLEGRHTLIILHPGTKNIFKSLRNVKGVRVLRHNELNTYNILWADNLVFTQDALKGVEEVFGS